MRRTLIDFALKRAVPIAQRGFHGVSMDDLGTELGVSGPALYRYFAGRDALLTELILDAYDELGAVLRNAGPGVPALADAYRTWATANPHRYRLLFGAPLPGYDAHDERLVTAAQRAMDVLLGMLDSGPAPDPALAEQLTAWIARRSAATGVDAGRAMHAISAWTRLHGLVSLEIEGNFASMGLNADRLFAHEVAALEAQ